MEIEKLELLRQEYNETIPVLNKYRDALLCQLEKILEQEKINLGFPIQHRIKEWESIVEKNMSGRYSIHKSILELQDIVGIRIILFFNRDVENVSKLIEKYLTIIKQYDTTDKLKEDQFGYNSIHFVIRIPDNWNSLFELDGIENYCAEIQVRTLSQHIWAEASRLLQYKQEPSIPRPLRRSIGRISALLEIVDLEFERLLTEREKYKSRINLELTSFKNISLDVDNLEAILDLNLPANNKILNEPYAQNLLELNYCNIHDKFTLEKFINKNISKAMEIEKSIVQKYIDSKGDQQIIHSLPYSFDENRIQHRVYLSHVGLIRAMLRIEYPEKLIEYGRIRPGETRINGQ